MNSASTPPPPLPLPPPPPPPPTHIIRYPYIKNNKYVLAMQGRWKVF